MFSSYLPRHGRGFYPLFLAQFLWYLWVVSVPQADNIISNEKYLLTFLPIPSTKMRIVLALNIKSIILDRLRVKQMFCFVKFDKSTCIVTNLAILF